MLGQGPSKQGYMASYVYMDREIMHIAHGQMHLSEGRVPEKEDEVVVSEYFLSTYGHCRGKGDVCLHFCPVKSRIDAVDGTCLCRLLRICSFQE